MAVGPLHSLVLVSFGAQDWDFPDFSGEGVKIVAVDFSSITIRLPEVFCLNLWKQLLVLSV